MMLLRVPDNGSFMVAAYAVVGVVLLGYALRLIARVSTARRAAGTPARR
jgi:CcmD family protein